MCLHRKPCSLIISPNTKITKNFGEINSFLFERHTKPFSIIKRVFSKNVLNFYKKFSLIRYIKKKMKTRPVIDFCSQFNVK